MRKDNAIRTLATSILFCSVVTTAHAQSAEQMRSVQHAAQIGQELYAHDQAAWHATDAMLADIPDPRAEGLHGWIAERTPSGIVVLFVRPDGDALTAVYRVLYRDGAMVEHGRVNQPLTAQESALYITRQAAIQAPVEHCSESYNTVTLPREHVGDNGVDVDVYLMPGTTQTDVYPFGGYYRLGMNTATHAVIETQRFTNSCIQLSTAATPGVTARGLFITQIIGDVPTEVHVFVSLEAHAPVFVGTRSGVWEVDGAQVRLVPPSEAPPVHPT
jgi:hypothetical protein